jgi:hypothetical protein
MNGSVTRGAQCFFLLTILLPGSLGCRALRAPAGEPKPLTPERAVAINSSVRAFMRDVAYDVTKNGPAAWQKHFVAGPDFFMAANGNWVFQNSAEATTGIQGLATSINQIILDWGGDLRVDPLAHDLAMVATPYDEIRVDNAGVRVEENGFFTGVAQYGDGRWKFRDAHWSVPVPPRAAPKN